MKRIITISLAIFTFLALSTFAQNRADKLRADGYNTDGTRIGNNVSIDDISVSTEGISNYQIHFNGTAVLYDQTGNPSGDGDFTSQDFVDPGNDPFDNQGADDFEVPAGETWTVDQVLAVGSYYNGSGPALGFNVFFYANDNGVLPGTEVYSALNQGYTDDGVGGFTVNLSTPAVLPEGTYWVSVQCYMEFAVGGQWGWEVANGPALNHAAWQNPGDGFGTGATTWTDAQSVFGWVGSEYSFAILGSTGGGGGLLNQFMDDFESGTTDNWVIGGAGPCFWMVVDLATFPWGLPPSPPPDMTGMVVTANSDDCGSGMQTTMISAAPIDVSLATIVQLEYDSDFENFGSPGADLAEVSVSTDGGATWVSVFIYPDDTPAEHAVFDLSSMVAGTQFLLKFEYNAPGWDWYWILDNIAIWVDVITPVELTSFTSSVSGNDVTLNWSTATEVNNQGFNVERNSGNGFEKVGFVAGFGTTTEQHSYSFVDDNLSSGSYTYRLKQVDYDGTFEYSEEIQVDITTPDVYSLEQNYPNPFNPSTQIAYGLAVDSKVTLKVFDVLGQEVATLINGNVAAGNHEINFNASNLNSGVYFYKIEATGVDGTNFTSVKKMILTK